MKTKRSFTIMSFTLLLTLTLTNCSKSPKCWGDNKNKGDIIENFELPECYSAKISSDDNYVIRNLNDLDTLENCNPAPFPVDFSQYSIIAQRVSGQCNMKVIRELVIDHTNKEYNYNITVKECGLCKMLILHNQIVLVPAIPDNYTVNFAVEYK